MKGPGKSFREGISLVKLTAMFPDEDAARKWWEAALWRDGRVCGHCRAMDSYEVAGGKPMPYWCRACKAYFSVRTGTVLADSRLPLRKWALAIYIYVTSLKGVSSMKLHRDLEITQKTAWFLLHRLREAWSDRDLELMTGPVEVDETYIGGKEGNKHKGKKLKAGRGGVGKAIVAGAKDRETNRVSAGVVRGTDAGTLQGFVADHAAPGATVYTDDARAYLGLPYAHEAVRHGVSEYVQGMAHVNGIESFWALLKRGYHGTYHHMSPKHLSRYVGEFSGRHNARSRDTVDQMESLAAGLAGKRLTYKALVE